VTPWAVRLFLGEAAVSERHDHPSADGERAAALTLRERRQPDGAMRLSLAGELDLGTAASLERKLTELKNDGAETTLVLSELGFIDSAGLRVLLRVTGEARRDGWKLAIERGLTPQVAKLFQITGADRVFWSCEH
jgi:anti-anti-sigma factor